MEDIIRDIQAKIQQNRFPNEASISQGIVLRLVRSLGWDVDDIDAVWPEFTIGTQRADFALCHPAGKPLVLIEVKQVGTMSPQAEEQLAAYAFRQGVPLVVLTSGQDWHFYAPYGPGQFSDRRIYRLDLLERTPQEAVERLQRYLSHSEWTQGQASLSVQLDLREMLGNQETRRKLPEAWASLLSEPNPQLVELLTSQLEKQTGSEPPFGEVVRFLQNIAGKNESGPTSVATVVSRRPERVKSEPTKHTVTSQRPPGTIKRRVSRNRPRLWINDKEIPVNNHRDRFIHVMSYLAEVAPILPEQFAGTYKPGQRPTFARTPQGLFPKSAHLAEQSNNWAELSTAPGWYLDLNKSASTIQTLIAKACKLAGVKLGQEIKLD